MTSKSRSKSGREGYTLLEALVTLFIIIEILVAVLILFDFNTKVGRAQMQVSEAQQSVRIAQNTLVRTLRMAGRGGLERGSLPGPVGERFPDIPGGMTLSLQSNVADNTEVAPGQPGSPIALPGTDILTVRGVVVGTTGYLSTGAATPGRPDGGPNVILADPMGTFQIPRLWRPIGFPVGAPGVPAAVAPFEEAAVANRSEVILLTSRVDPNRYTLVEFDPTTTTPGTDPLTVGFRFTGTDLSDALQTLAPVSNITDESAGNAISARFLEEYRFFIRQPPAGLDAIGGRNSPVLSVARMIPFTNLPYNGDPANLDIEIAENVWDLQVALGIDTSRDGQIADGEVTAGLDPASDEWLYNDPGDDDSPLLWNAAVGANPPLHSVRVTTLAVTDRPDLKWGAPTMLRLEDRTYDENTDPLNTPIMRQFRRRAVQTIVDLRGM